MLGEKMRLYKVYSNTGLQTLIIAENKDNLFRIINEMIIDDEGKDSSVTVEDFDIEESIEIIEGEAGFADHKGIHLREYKNDSYIDHYKENE